MKRRLLVMVILALLVTTVAAPVAAQDTSNTLRIALEQELDTLSPWYTSMWFSTTVQDAIHSSAWVIDNNLNAVPVIAAEIPSLENGGLSEDGTVITFHIRDNAVWSDGTPITSDDFVFTYEMVLDPANTVTSRNPYDTVVSSIEGPDASTVVITTSAPYAPWLATLGMVPLPAHVLRPVFEADGTLDNATWNREPTVTSGAYIFQNWETGSEINLTRNPAYFLDAAKIENIQIQFVPDSASTVAALITGDTDVGTFIAAGDTPAMEEAGTINVELVPSGYNEGLFFNMDPELAHPALQDVNVRRAIVMLVDRDGAINTDLNGGLLYTGSSYWEATPYQNPDVTAIPFDPAGAMALLDEAGWVDSNGDGTRDKDGVELVLRYVTNQRQLRIDVMAVVQQSFADAGVGVELQNLPSDQFFADYANGGPMSLGEYDLGEYSSAPSFPDPNTTRFLCQEIPSDENPVGINDNHYCNPALDELFAQQEVTIDPEARVVIFHQIDQILADDIVWVNMWYDPDLWAVNKRVSNTNISGADPLWNIANWEITG
jgi:peptide/nickel transport system substrate-binding protein